MRLIKPHRFRVVLLGSLFIGLTVLVGARLHQLQYVEHAYYEERANAQHFKRVVIQAQRGDILDRAGRPLAQSTGRLTVYIHPKYLRAPEYESSPQPLIEALSHETGRSYENLSRLFEGGAPTALARRVRTENARRIIEVMKSFDVDGRGYWLHRESIRLYPRHLAAPVIGFCRKGGDGDNEGLAGLELNFNEELSGQKIYGVSQRTGISETLEPWKPSDILAASGNTLVLTFDANLQEEVESILADTIAEHEADSGGVVVMDPQSGAVLAMASYPTFDNNEFSTAAPATMRNRTLTDPLETGSVAKLFTGAILLDQGYVTPETLIDCENGFAVVDGRRLRDSPGHFLGIATFREAMRWSSNIGIVKAAQTLENDLWYGYLRDFGFGAPTGIDLPGEGSGILYPVRRWTKFSRTSLPMGYEMALTPVQIAAAISAVVNGGTYYEPYVVSEVRDPEGKTIKIMEPKARHQVIRPTTSSIMRDLMEDVVVKGTGQKARIPSHRIGGKTGTTRKSDIFDRREYIASFVGVFPINAPRVTIYVYIDNPRGEYYASAVAAPAFQKIATAAALHLGIPPSEDYFHTLGVDRLYAPPGQNAFIHQDAYHPAFVGTMPDFAGMTMGDVRSAIPHDIAAVKFLGSGYVSDQFPPAGDPLNEHTDVVLHFSPQRPAAKVKVEDQTAVSMSNSGDRR